MCIDEFLLKKCSIIIIEEILYVINEQSTSEAVNSTISIIDWLQLSISFITLLGGAWCFVQIKKLKEKKIDAMFSFLIRLSVHLHLLYSDLEKYGDYILNTLINPNEREAFLSNNENSYSDNIVTNFLYNCKETLKLLMESDNQVPLQKGWIEKYNTLIEFLDIYVKTEDEDFYIWEEDIDSQKNKFYTKHKNNIENMLSEIKDEEKKLEEKISKKFLDHFKK